jgi:hypothetical protein
MLLGGFPSDSPRTRLIKIAVINRDLPCRGPVMFQRARGRLQLKFSPFVSLSKNQSCNESKSHIPHGESSSRERNEALGLVLAQVERTKRLAAHQSERGLRQAPQAIRR